MYIPVSLKNIDLTQAVLLSILIHGVFFISFDNNFIPKVQQDLEISFNPGIFEESNPKIKDQKVKLTHPKTLRFYLKIHLAETKKQLH